MRGRALDGGAFAPGRAGSIRNQAASQESLSAQVLYRPRMNFLEVRISSKEQGGMVVFRGCSVALSAVAAMMQSSRSRGFKARGIFAPCWIPR
jgi:hypothetical protein